MKKFINNTKAMVVDAHMCAFGMTSEDEHGIWLVLKPTSCMTNTPKIANHLNRQCSRIHGHVHLINGRAANAAIYPGELCETRCNGVREQLDHDGMIKRMPR